ncbi:thermonuclease family protein [Rhizobium halophytocola]|uniref:Endonuclease YncB(Thermonuclease family) n=1 Tax=Rhizobium halophytocola TaxID=735519 RepID=A0ABS4E1S3_9HYPH|nr:thermonuclease family protein [Rhizobium halophytocola]MBP1851866.1 endonuclease YncB(thermonuclease family) [Rhizobium halophytocola]
MRNLSRIALLACLFTASGLAGQAVAAQHISGPVTATIIRIVDGDTMLVDAEPWPQQIMRVYVRLRGIDAPEKRSKCSAMRAAGARAQTALAEMTAASPTITLIDISGDKYFGRIVADVVLNDGQGLSDKLLQAGLVRPYDGGRKLKLACTL